MNIVIKNANDVSNWFGGCVAVPMAVRRKWNTTTIRVKHVIITNIDGASVRTVRTSNICIDVENPCGVASLGFTPTEILGIEICAKEILLVSKWSIAIVMIMINDLCFNIWLIMFFLYII
jgi:hypothetical protein